MHIGIFYEGREGVEAGKVICGCIEEEWVLRIGNLVVGKEEKTDKKKCLCDLSNERKTAANLEQNRGVDC